MKVIKLSILIFFTFNTFALTEVIDCSKLSKLSKDYAKCIANKTKIKSKEVKENITSDENKKKLSIFKLNIKKKLKNFKESKTGEEFFKKE